MDGTGMTQDIAPIHIEYERQNPQGKTAFN
jgi:hypothetical protein